MHQSNQQGSEKYRRKSINQMSRVNRNRIRFTTSKLNFQFVKSAPGLRHLCRDYWFLQSKEQFQYSEFVDNNASLEDEALMCFLHNQDEQNLDKDESTDESTDDMDIYNGVNNIKHRERNISNCSTDDEDVDMEFFCDHF